MDNREQFRKEMIEELKPLLEVEADNTEASSKDVEDIENVEEKTESEAQGESESVEEVEEPETSETSEENKEEEKTESESSEESLLELERQLSGHTKEFKDLVKSLKDPELQKKALEAGKVSRAREDRFASELGEVKKQYELVSNFKQMLETSPQDTILQIAKMANLDLKALVEPTAADESEEYLLPEEKALNSKMKNIEQQNKLLAQKLEAIEQAKVREQQEMIAQEIEAFVANKEKYPYFEDVQDSIADLLTLEKNKSGLPKNSQERIARLEKAYNKALLLDDNLLQKRDEDLKRQLEAKRRADVEKAKSQKKVANTYAKNPTSPASIKDELIAEYKKMGL